MAKFVKGQPKPPNSGRKKGSKKTMKSIRQGLADLDFDLSFELKKLFTHPEASIDHQIQIAKLIAQHTQAPVRDDDDDNVIEADFTEIDDQELESKLKSI